MSIRSSQEITRLSIVGELTIFRAQELQPVLLASPPCLELDLSGVTELDTAGVHVLVYFAVSFPAQDRE